MAGRPKIMEPERCVEMKWFSAGQLPSPMFVSDVNLFELGSAAPVVPGNYGKSADCWILRSIKNMRDEKRTEVCDDRKKSRKRSLENIRKGRASAVIIKDGRVLFIKRIKPNKVYYVFPGGGVEADESFEEGL